MAWLCSSASNGGLVGKLKEAGYITSAAVENAFLAVDRANYAPIAPYQDSPQPLGYGQTISAPHMHAACLQSFEDIISSHQHGASYSPQVLDVGVGSGYLATIFARVNPQARVYGIDIVPELVTLSRINIGRGDSELLESNRITLSCKDGWQGWVEYAPFDCIHVGAAAAEVPQQLLQQLKVGGRMVIPVGPEGGSQVLYQIDRTGEQFQPSSYAMKELMGVRYVPLVKPARPDEL